MNKEYEEALEQIRNLIAYGYPAWFCAKHILSLWGDGWQIALVKPDAELPPIPRKDIVHIIAERDRILLGAGWRKVIENDNDVIGAHPT